MTTNRTTAQEKIKLQLLQELGVKWPVGSRLPPITQLAHALNAGHRNTFLALQELAREGYVQSRRKAGTHVIKAPVSSPLPSAGQPRPTVGILCPAPVPSAISGPLVEAFTQAMDRLGHRVEVLVARPKEYDLTARRYASFGAIAMIQPEVAPITLRKDQPAVIIQTTTSLMVLGNGNYDIVAPDEEHASSLAAITFRQAGCTSAAFVGVARDTSPHTYDPISQARLRGFEAGWGAPIPQAHQFMTRCYGEGSGARCVMDYQCLTRKPDAIFAASDELAIGFAMGAMAMGFESTRDYQIIGFDAQPKGREISGIPPLTSISVPLADMGRRGAQLLSSRLANPTKRLERVLLSCDIHFGETVKTPNLISMP